MDKVDILRKNPNMVKRTIGNETVLVPIYKSSKEINCIYTLNNDAAKIFEMIDGKKAVFEIESKILKDFLVDEKDARVTLDKFFKELKEIEAVLVK